MKFVIIWLNVGDRYLWLWHLTRSFLTPLPRICTLSLLRSDDLQKWRYVESDTTFYSSSCQITVGWLRFLRSDWSCSRWEGGVGVRCWCWADCVYLRISAPLPLMLPLDGCASQFDVRSYIEGFIWFQKRRKKTIMTDSTTSDPCPVPNPTIVDPSAVRNGQCAAAQDPNLPKRGSQDDPFNMDRDQEMKITDSVEGQGKHT